MHYSDQISITDHTETTFAKLIFFVHLNLHYLDYLRRMFQVARRIMALIIKKNQIIIIL